MSSRSLNVPDTARAPASTPLWGTFDLALEGPSAGNPYLDVELAATFSFRDRLVEVTGFYDGDGTYRIRFMPDIQGEWSYRTTSNVPALNGITGAASVGPAHPDRHGPVKVADTHHFRYADGTRYINIGTTAYVWNLQGDRLEEQTLASLAEAPFTKIRMCVFPKHYRYNQNEPDRYPFLLVRQGQSKWPARIEDSGWEFDYDQPNPDYFRHLEKRISSPA
jgi:hypothetical protein